MPLSLLVDMTCSSFRLNKRSSSFRSIHTCQEGLLWLPAQSQEHTRIPAITRGLLERAVEVHQPSSRTGICTFVLGEPAGTLPEPYKVTSNGLLVCVSDQTVAVRVILELNILYRDLCSLQLDWHLPNNSRTGGPLLLGQQVHTEQMWQMWKSVDMAWQT